MCLRVMYWGVKRSVILTEDATLAPQIMFNHPNTTPTLHEHSGFRQVHNLILPSHTYLCSDYSESFTYTYPSRIMTSTLQEIDQEAADTLLLAETFHQSYRTHLERVRVLNHMHNVRTYASTLPAQILVWIFHITLSVDWFGDKDDRPNANRSVWMSRNAIPQDPSRLRTSLSRTAALSYPASGLWRRSIDLTRRSRHHLKSMLMRSGPGKDVSLNTDPATFPSALKTLSDISDEHTVHAIRIVAEIGFPTPGELKSLGDRANWMERTLADAMEEEPLPYRLEVLVIQGGPWHRFKLPTRLFKPNLSRSSNLRSVTLTNCTQLNWASFSDTLCGLVDLTLENIDYRGWGGRCIGTMGAFISMLRKSPFLESLRLKPSEPLAYEVADESWLQEIEGNAEPLHMPKLQYLSISHPCNGNHGFAVDHLIAMYMAVHLASFMVIPESACLEFIFPSHVESSVLQRLWGIAMRGQPKVIPELKFKLHVWNHKNYHFFDLYALKDGLPQSPFRVRQDTSADKNMDIIIGIHEDRLPLTQIFHLEIDADHSISPLWFTVDCWGSLMRRASNLEVLSIVKSFNLTVYALKWAQRGLKKVQLTEVDVERKLVDVLGWREKRGMLNSPFELVFERCSVTGKIIDLDKEVKVTWDGVFDGADLDYEEPRCNTEDEASEAEDGDSEW
ncbi:hypothetical protein C8R43DRAFT_1212132 [Mycena crocata]|nr:hypothetical protein C8R43DRAFT_1212132 [Mycena crocata]